MKFDAISCWAPVLGSTRITAPLFVPARLSSTYSDAAGADRDAGGVVEASPARSDTSALAAGDRVDADDRAVLLVRHAHVGDDEAAVGLDGEVVGALEEGALRPVARDLDGRAGRGIGAQDHRAVDVLVRRVHDVRVGREGVRGPRREQRRRPGQQDRDARAS